MLYIYITLLVSAFALKHIDFSIKSVCEDNSMALAVVPEDYQELAYPVLAWAHGMGAELDVPWMERLAEEGYVVVAARGCRKGYVAAEHSANQLIAIDWVLNVQTDFEVQNQVGVIGHSMGGRASIMSTLHHEPYFIKAAVAAMPAIYISNAETPQVPTFFVGGTRDKLAPWETILDWYQRTQQVDKALAIRFGTGHEGYQDFEDSILKFLDCHVRENYSACLFFYPPKSPEMNAKSQEALCDDSHLKVCYSSEYDPANPEAEIEYFHKLDDEECKDTIFIEEFDERIPCELAAIMSDLVLGECPMFLNQTCCASCNPGPEEQTYKLSAAETCVDKEPLACPYKANEMFKAYGQCPRSVAEGCCASCATLKLRALSPENKLTCPGWPFDLVPRCTDDLGDCKHLAKQGLSLFGECPAFLKVMCCASCHPGKEAPSKPELPPSTDITEAPIDYAYDYPYDSGEPSVPESPNSNKIDDLCPAGQEWNKCGNVCPPECDDGNHIFKCTANFCVPQCDCTNGKFKDGNGECTYTACQVWEDMDTFDFIPFDPRHVPGFDPHPHPHHPHGPVHPDNIPIHTPDSQDEVVDNTDLTGEDYYSGELAEECVNEDSSRDRRGHTCTEWYDNHPQDCGRYDRHNHGFTARTQCCACFANLSESHETDPNDWTTVLAKWEFAAGAGVLGGILVAVISIHICRLRQRKRSSLDFNILLEDVKDVEKEAEITPDAAYSLRD